jgi:8-oxo-dGTP pyrophosphatase MutT (NUDIX family)
MSSTTPFTQAPSQNQASRPLTAVPTITIPKQHLSSNFVISCGTITLDLRHRKILLLKWRPFNEILLPKGRKDVGEAREAAALRETYEETGLRVDILPTNAKTLQTVPRVQTKWTAGQEATGRDTTTTASANTGIAENNAKLHKEPIAVQHRITSTGVLKIIFWYAATGDSEAVPDEGTQDEGEDFENLWVEWEGIDAALTWEDDRTLAKYVVDVVGKMGVADVIQ